MLLNQFWGEHLVEGFPGVVCFWVALPFDQVLELVPSAMEAMVSNGLDFILLFSVHYVRGRFRKIDPMLLCLAIRRQQASVEDIMDGPGWGELELISNRRDSLVDNKGTMTSGGQLRSSIREIKVLRLQPDPVAYFVLVRRGLPDSSIECFFGLLPPSSSDFQLIFRSLIL